MSSYRRSDRHLLREAVFRQILPLRLLDGETSPRSGKRITNRSGSHDMLFRKLRLFMASRMKSEKEKSLLPSPCETQGMCSARKMVP